MCAESAGVPVSDVTPVSMTFVNAFIIQGADHRLVLVDTGTPGSAPRIVSAIEALGCTPSQVALIVITHAHLDHFGSVRALKALTAAPVAIHRSEARYLVEGRSTAVVPTSLMGHLLRLVARPSQVADGVQPDVLIDDELDLGAFGVSGRVIATPGHTAGSVSVLLHGGECLVGDLVMAFRKPSFPIIAQDTTLIGPSIRKVIDCGATKIYPSHGAACSVDRIRQLV